MISFRDPHVEETIQTFSNSIDWIRSHNFEEQNLNEAKLKLFSDIDSPISPSSKGVSEWKSGITHDLSQQNRLRTINVQRDDLIQVGEKYFSLLKNSPVIAVVGDEQNTSKYQEKGNWEIVNI